MTKQMRGGPHYARTFPDCFTYGGAQQLATTIRNFWMGKGKTPKVEVVPDGDMWAVRSNMVGGQPV